MCPIVPTVVHNICLVYFSKVELEKILGITFLKTVKFVDTESINSKLHREVVFNYIKIPLKLA